VDVEWAFDPEGYLVILQLRPITTLHVPVEKGRSLFEHLSAWEALKGLSEGQIQAIGAEAKSSLPTAI